MPDKVHQAFITLGWLRLEGEKVITMMDDDNNSPGT